MLVVQWHEVWRHSVSKFRRAVIFKNLTRDAEESNITVGIKGQETIIKVRDTYEAHNL